MQLFSSTFQVLNGLGKNLNGQQIASCYGNDVAGYVLFRVYATNNSLSDLLAYLLPLVEK